MEFDWDDGNLSKTLKHGLTHAEIESVFQDPHLFLFAPYEKNSEIRYNCTGLAYTDRLSTITFTNRNGKVRPISARAAKRPKEHEAYWARRPRP